MVEVSGGADLAKALGEMSRKLSKAGTLRVGFINNATYPNGTSVALVAAIQEYGAPSKGIPPRPFFRNAIKTYSASWARQLSDYLKLNDYDVDSALNALGEVVKGEIAQSIFDLYEPPLSDITVMLRGMRSQARYRDMSFWQQFAIAKGRVAKGQTNYGASTKPLIDTGHLSNSITYDVKS